MATIFRRVFYVILGQIAAVEQSHKSSVRGTCRTRVTARGEYLFEKMAHVTTQLSPTIYTRMNNECVWPYYGV